MISRRTIAMMYIIRRTLNKVMSGQILMRIFLFISTDFFLFLIYQMQQIIDHWTIDFQDKKMLQG